MSEHRALGGSGGAGGVDNGGKVVGLDGARDRFSVGIEGTRALAHELIHKRARSRKITGDLDAIHDYDSLDLRLVENRADPLSWRSVETKTMLAPESRRV